jgi:hypothetical protein
MKTATLDGKRIAYTDDTEFLVQIGRGRSAYETKYQFKGEIGRAVFYYNAINIGRGYKKRLIMPDAIRPVLARELS